MTFKIPFNKPCYTGNEDEYVLNSMKSLHISGNGPYTKKCEEWFENRLKCKRALLAPSCTPALEMGKGLGKFLWLESLSNMMTHGLEHATTRISANNVAALNLHTRLGFKFKNPASMFHYWG
jgi:hypothetical protein